MKRILFSLSLALLASSAYSAADGSASTSWPSLQLQRGARAASLGGAYTALASGADGLQWNPAGMNQVRAFQGSAGHLSWLDGVADDYLMVALPIYGLGAWGFGFDYLNASGQSYDIDGNPTVPYQVYEFMGTVGLSLELPWDMHAGISYKILRQGYVTQNTMGSAFDLGWQWRDLFKRLDLGASMLNAGTPVALGNIFYYLPLTLRLGSSFEILPTWRLMVDYEYQPIDLFNKLRLGTEYDQVAGPAVLTGRIGQVFGADQQQGDWAGLGAGLGVGLGKWQVDYAFTPQGDLGQAHRISLTYSSWK